MIISSFSTQVIQNVLAVLTPEETLNDWSKQEYLQGFSWRPQSTSFRTIDDGNTQVEIHLENKLSISKAAVRAIVVPFHVPNCGVVEVRGIYEDRGHSFSIKEGRYAALFQLGHSRTTHAVWCKISFVPSRMRMPRVLRHDSDLKPPNKLVMNGKPA